MKTKNLHIIQKTWTNACRFLLAAAFIFSGFVKAVDPLGSQYKIQDYLEAFGMISWFPSFFPLLAAVILSAIEFSVGVCMFFGIRKTTTTILALLIMLFMTPLTLYLALKNPVSDCGCFGDAWVLTNWETFGKNIVLLIAVEETDYTFHFGKDRVAGVAVYCIICVCSFILLSRTFAYSGLSSL